MVEARPAETSVEPLDETANASDIAAQLAQAFAFMGESDSDGAETEASTDGAPVQDIAVEEPPTKRARTEASPTDDMDSLQSHLSCRDSWLKSAVPVGIPESQATPTDFKAGMLPPLTDCSRCGRKGLAGVGDAGVFCGRVSVEGTFIGCGAAVCWRCMKRAPNDQLGKLRTSKEECESMGQKAWWMHDFCMREVDTSDYYGSADAAVEAAAAKGPSDASTPEEQHSRAHTVAPTETTTTDRYAWE